jgi:hypothetical protein
MDWDKIVSSAVSTLVGGIIVGAGVVVWNGATSVDDKIEAAQAAQQEQFDALVIQREYMIEAVEVMEEEIIRLNNKINDLSESDEILKEAFSKKDFNVPLLPSGGHEVETPTPTQEYFEDDYIQQQLPQLNNIPSPSRTR